MFHILCSLFILCNYSLIFFFSSNHSRLKFRFFLSIKTLFYSISSIPFLPHFFYFHFMQLALWKRFLLSIKILFYPYLFYSLSTPRFPCLHFMQLALWKRYFLSVKKSLLPLIFYSLSAQISLLLFYAFFSMKEVLLYHTQHIMGYCASYNIKFICLHGHFHMVVDESTFVPQI